MSDDTGMSRERRPAPGEPRTDASLSEDSPLEESMIALAEARQRLAEIPADVVVSNHAMGLFELAAIHLSAEPPNLPSSSLAIDALACLVEGLSGRLGENSSVLTDALANIRMAFVEVSNRT